jgi:hypothetical protein
MWISIKILGSKPTLSRISIVLAFLSFHLYVGHAFMGSIIALPIGILGLMTSKDLEK